jgi:hypothetical protein
MHAFNHIHIHSFINACINFIASLSLLLHRTQSLSQFYSEGFVFVQMGSQTLGDMHWGPELQVPSYTHIAFVLQNHMFASQDYLVLYRCMNLDQGLEVYTMYNIRTIPPVQVHTPIKD